MNLKNVLFFSAGLLTGVAGGIMATKKYFENKYSEIAEKQISEMEDYYQRIDEYSRIPEEDGEVNPTNNESSFEKNLMKSEKRDTSKDVDYASIYNKKNGIEMSEEEVEDNETEVVMKETLDDRIHVIDGDELGDLPNHFENETLFLNMITRTLYDEDNNEIENPELLIGDLLTDADFLEAEDEIAYIANHKLDICYEVVKTYN